MQRLIFSRDRLLTCLRGQVADRVPVAPFVQEEYLSYFFPERAVVDRVKDARELADAIDFDLIAKPKLFEKAHFLRRSYPNWELRQKTVRGDGQVRIRTVIITPARTLCQTQVGPDVGAATAGVHMATEEHFLKSREDIEAFIAYMPPLDDEDRRQMQQTARQWQALLDQRGVLAPWGWCSVYNHAAEYRGMETLMLDPYEDPELFANLMQRLAEAMVQYNVALAETAIDAVGIQGNIANSAVIGPDFFRQNIQPYEKQVIDAVHACGKFTIYHNCGVARALWGSYRELDFTVWETVAEPPRGDNSLADAKRTLGDRMVLLGNLDQVDFLKVATEAQVIEQTRAIVQAGKPGGRYIFSTSDYLERNTPLQNVKAMIAAAKDAGRYS